MADSERPADDPTGTALQTPETAEAEDELEMDLRVAIEEVGPCRKHVRVTVPREGIDRVRQAAIDELMESADVPGFRKGHAAEKLIEKRFKDSIGDQVKQKVLLQSLKQLGDEKDLNPINEPDIDVESLVLPDEGDFEYEFDVEVRPSFDLPQYKGLRIERPVKDVTDEDVDRYCEEFLEQYGHLEPIEEAARSGDSVTLSATFTHGDEVLRKIDEFTVRLRPVLRFQDAEIDGFDELLDGVRPGDVRETDLSISMEADAIEMRGETVTARFTVLDVKRLQSPELDQKFFERIGVTDAGDLKDQVRSMLERQVTYRQRQTTRDQVMEQITASADWELPEELVRKQTENALRREILEMRQAGFTPREIQARENELRQRSVTMTRKNLKQHFVLDRIAEHEDISVTPAEIDVELTLMAMQAGENPRRVRARLQKSGMIENLDAQIRERKAVDIILEHAQFTDIEMESPTSHEVEAVARSICSQIEDTEVDAESAEV